MNPSVKAVLVVDDDLDIRETLKEILEDEGFVVACAANGQEALDHLRVREPKPGVVLLDLMMPVKNGWEFLEEVRADPSLVSVPVVILTADARIDSSVLKLGAAGFLKKPLDLETLLGAVHRFYRAPEPA